MQRVLHNKSPNFATLSGMSEATRGRSGGSRCVTRATRRVFSCFCQNHRFSAGVRAQDLRLSDSIAPTMGYVAPKRRLVPRDTRGAARVATRRVCARAPGQRIEIAQRALDARKNTSSSTGSPSLGSRGSKHSESGAVDRHAIERAPRANASRDGSQTNTSNSVRGVLQDCKVSSGLDKALQRYSRSKLVNTCERKRNPEFLCIFAVYLLNLPTIDTIYPTLLFFPP